jgi:hypothetical protein
MATRIGIFAFTLACIVLCSVPPAAAVPTADQIANVEKQIKDAEKEAADNAPANARVKKMEDELDAAARKQDDLPANATDKARQDAADGVKQAKESADIMRDAPRVRDTDDKEKAGKYRDALEKRRQARKQLKTWQTELRDAIQQARQNKLFDADQTSGKLKRRVDTALQQIDKTFQVATSTPATKGAPTASTTVTKGPPKTKFREDPNTKDRGTLH